MKKIERLGLKHDFDLRTVEEAEARPDRIPTGVEYHLLNVLADAKAIDTAKLLALVREPEKANKELGGGKAEALFERMYREFIHFSSATNAYSKMFSTMARPEGHPVLFHCTAGRATQHSTCRSRRHRWRADALHRGEAHRDPHELRILRRHRYGISDVDRGRAAQGFPIQAMIEAGLRTSSPAMM